MKAAYALQRSGYLMLSVARVNPRVSVIIRSFNRLGILAELLERLLAQDHDSFEIVVVEQSIERPVAELARVEALARDRRVRIERFEPLGGPRARNEGVRASRGEILVFIDDDDLPIGTDWLRRHERHYADPKCLGMTGRSVVEGQEGRPLYANMDAARRRVLSLNALRFQRVYVGTDRYARVQSLHGSNFSVRRSTLERFGLWDECTPIEDELSLAYRMQASLARGDEYLVFDPETVMLRRLDAPGGMAKRALAPHGYAKKLFTFMHNVTGHYYPARFALLYPIYFVYVGYLVTDWVFTMSRRHRSLGHRLLSLGAFYAMLPVLWVGWLAAWSSRRLVDGPFDHHPELAPLTPALDRAGLRPAPLPADLVPAPAASPP